MRIYLDNDFCAHITQDETVSRIEWDDEDGFFDGKCETFIEGYRVIPGGETWMRKDGISFNGPMITPAVSFSILEAAQSEYEKAEATIAELDAALLDATYQSIMGGIE